MRSRAQDGTTSAAIRALLAGLVLVPALAAANIPPIPFQELATREGAHGALAELRVAVARSEDAREARADRKTQARRHGDGPTTDPDAGPSGP